MVTPPLTSLALPEVLHCLIFIALSSLVWDSLPPAMAPTCRDCLAQCFGIESEDLEKDDHTSMSEKESQRTSCFETTKTVLKLLCIYLADSSSRTRAMPLLLVSVSFTGLSVYMGYVGATAFQPVVNALSSKDSLEFGRAFELLILCQAGWAVVDCIRSFIVSALSLDWQQYLTMRLLQKYADQNHGFYKLKLHHGSIDNPDQRIAKTVASFTKMSVSVMATVVQALAQVCTSAIALLQVSPSVCIILLGFASLFSLCSFAFTIPMTAVQCRMQAKDASFRHVLMRMREHAEPIAFLQGEGFERACSQQALSRVIWQNYQLKVLNALLKLCANFGQVGLLCLPVMLVAPLLFSDKVDLGSWALTERFFGYLMSNLLALGHQVSYIAKIHAYAYRIQELWHQLDSIGIEEVAHSRPTHRWLSEVESLASDTPRDSRDSSLSPLQEYYPQEWATQECVTLVSGASDSIPVSMADVKLRTRTVEVSVSGRIDLRQGESLLLLGGSGCGKTLLLRAFANLFKNGSGTITRPALPCCFFVPQSPYLCLGSFRDNLLYPHSKTSQRSRTEIDSVVKALKLDRMIENHGGIDQVPKADQPLSRSERQRLNLARPLLYEKQLRLLLLDDATTDLDQEMKDAVYKLIQQLKVPFISVGSDWQLMGYHTYARSATNSSDSIVSFTSANLIPELTFNTPRW